MYPDYTPEERRCDAVIHVTGVTAAVIATGILLVLVIPSGDPLRIIASAIYGLGLLTMLTVSATYHMIGHKGWQETLRCYDHSAIYLMIAGTYTPLCLVTLGGPLGHGLLAVIWSAALVGIGLKIRCPRRFERTSLILYLTMGWTGLFALRSLIETLPAGALALFVAGGLLYTAGVPFHLSTRKYQNAIWHAFVLAGTACHFGTVAYSVAA